jgi:hypothetical protein
MNDKDSQTLNHISVTLDTMLSIMQKPENRFIKALEIAGTVITVASLLSVIDTIRNWLGF